MAKQIWIVDFIQYKEKPFRNKISPFGSEYDNFNQHIAIFQEHSLIEEFSRNCPNTFTNKCRN